MADTFVISSLVVQVRPDRLDEAVRAIAEEPGAEIHASDAAGKLVVVLESRNDGDLADATRRIGDLPGVLSVNLVFHHTETTPAASGASGSDPTNQPPQGAEA